MFSAKIDDELELRLLEPRHAAALHELVVRNRDYLGRWLPWAVTESSVADSEAFIKRGLEQFAKSDGFQAGIWYRGELIGALGAHYINWQTRATELGYWLAETYQGKGLMTRAIRGACHSLFEEVGLNRVEIRADPENARSRAVPERLGFKQEGILRQVGDNNGRLFDHVVYSLLVNEWRERERQ